MKHYIYIKYSNGDVAYSSAFNTYREAVAVMCHYMKQDNPCHKNFWIESE